MSEIDQLIHAYGSHVAVPWHAGRSGSERIWFLVYSPNQERRMIASMEHFVAATSQAGKQWSPIDLSDAVPAFMMTEGNEEDYFQLPDRLDFDGLENFIAARLLAHIAKADENTVVAITGVSTLFSVQRLAQLIKRIDSAVKGRLLVFFPGSFENNTYHMLEAGDGWNYLATPITARPSLA